MSAKWKVGGSKVTKQGKNSVGMIKYMASQGLGAYQITTPFKNNHSDANMRQILADAAELEMAVGFHAVNYIGATCIFHRDDFKAPSVISLPARMADAKSEIKEGDFNPLIPALPTGFIEVSFNGVKAVVPEHLAA